jgi:hypothetical protein
MCFAPGNQIRGSREQIGLTDRKRAESRQFSWVEVQEKGNKEGGNERTINDDYSTV